MKLIKREDYFKKLVDTIDVPDIKVITGVRRSGKSKLLDSFYEYLTKLDNSNVIRIKLNLKKYEKLKNKDELYEYIDSNYVETKMNFVIIDEIQMCNDFETTIISLYEEERFNIYLTGSNAFLLSSDLATLFGGRAYEISVYPFSFKEYLKYYPSNDINASFDKYVEDGGMSGSYLYKTRLEAMNYVKGIYRTTIVKDIVDRYHIENEPLLIMVGNFLLDNIGSKTSLRNIARSIDSKLYKTNDKTVGSYVDYLCKSFMFYPISRYDIKGKKYLESDKKYYLSDLSFRYSEIGTKDADYGRLYENLVAIELLRRGYEVYVGVLYEKEVDFVAIKNGIKTYIQVSDDISRSDTFNREVRPLLAINDAYPKMLIARTKHPESQHEGIRIIDVAEWLNSKDLR